MAESEDSKVNNKDSKKEKPYGNFSKRIRAA